MTDMHPRNAGAVGAPNQACPDVVSVQPPRYYGAMHRSRSTVNFSSLDLNLLRVFDAIHTTRSVTIASSTLHLTQPAVGLDPVHRDRAGVHAVVGVEHEAAAAVEGDVAGRVPERGPRVERGQLPGPLVAVYSVMKRLPPATARFTAPNMPLAPALPDAAVSNSIGPVIHESSPPSATISTS